MIYLNIKNTLFKKYAHNNYIKHAIPIAYTYKSSNQILFYGFTESKNPEGIFLYNDGDFEYPIFICNNLDELQDTIELVEQDKINELKKRVDGDSIHFIELNEDFEIGSEELTKIFDFISRSHRNIFGKEMKIIYNSNTVELKCEHFGKTRYIKLELSEIIIYENLITVVSYLNHAISEQSTGRPEYYYYILGDKSIQLLHKEELVEFVRLGLIESHWFNPLPSIAYCSKPSSYRGKYDDEFLKMVKDLGWDPNTINRFLSDFRDSASALKFFSSEE